MSNENQSAAIQKPKKVFTLTKLFLMAMGTFVGSGVVSILGVAAGATGYSVWLAYLMACIIGFLAAAPYWLMSSMMYYNGGTYTIACTFLGPRFGGAYIISTFTSGIAIALMASAFGSYVASVFPSVNVRAAAIFVLTLFYIVNVLGIDFLAAVQKYSTAILLGALAVFCVLCFIRLEPATFDFSNPQFMTAGFTGLLGAMAMLVFSTQGYDANVYIMSKYTTKPLTNMPKAILMTLGGLILVYCGVAIAAVGDAGLDVFAGNPLTAVANVVFKSRILFYAFIVLGPIMCLTTTINGCFAGFTISFEKATEDGWFSPKFASKNRFGAPWKILTAVYVVCVLPLLFSVNIGLLTSNTVFLGSVLVIPLLISLFTLPDKFPEEFKKNTMHISPALYKAVVVVAWIARGVILYYSFRSLTLVNAIGSVTAVALCFLFAFLRHRTGKVKVTNSYSFDNDE